MFAEMADAYSVRIHPRKVARSSLSFVLPNDGKRAILRARDDAYLQPFLRLDISRPGCCILTAIWPTPRSITPKRRARRACSSRSTAALCAPKSRS